MSITSTAGPRPLSREETTWVSNSILLSICRRPQKPVSRRADDVTVEDLIANLVPVEVHRPGLGLRRGR